MQRAWLFPVRLTGSHPALRELLESPQVLKVGFGLGSDLAQLRAKLGIEARGILDLSQALPREAPNKTLGAKTAVARYLGRRMQKSKHVTTSNWGNPRLNERQMLYAANDAQVALRVYRLALAAPGDLNRRRALRRPRAPPAAATPTETPRSGRRQRPRRSAPSRPCRRRTAGAHP
jgi:ribonuclease D